jgi:hypothetical protein
LGKVAPNLQQPLGKVAPNQQQPLGKVAPNISSKFDERFGLKFGSTFLKGCFPKVVLIFCDTFSKSIL